MRHVTFFHKETGILNGKHLLVSDDCAVALNIPADHEAIDHPPEHMLDHLSQRVEVETGAVIDYEPPRPSEEHEWNAQVKRWQLRAEVVRERAVRTDNRLRVTQLRTDQHRFALRVLTDPEDDDARHALKRIRDEIGTLGGD